MEQALAVLTEEVRAMVALHETRLNQLQNQAEVLGGVMQFAGDVDNAAVNITNLDNGNFDDIQKVTETAPAAAFTVINLARDQVHDLDRTVPLLARAVLIRKDPSTTGANPLVHARVGVRSDGTNEVHGFSLLGGGSIYFDGVDLTFDDKAAPAASWSAFQSVVRHGQGSTVNVGFRGGSISALPGQGLVSATGGSIVNLGLNTAVLDGAFSAVIGMATGSATIAQHAVTYLNGATLTDGGTRGQNLIHN